MENIIKISSEQGFSETWKPASEKPTKKLLSMFEEILEYINYRYPIKDENENNT